MIRFKDLSIPKPCSVDYDSLPGNDVKRFCDSCQKHVYDFRGKDEAYLNDVYNTTGKVCGVYSEYQLQTPRLKIQQSFYRTFLAKLIGGVLFIKTIMSSYDSEAKVPPLHPIAQVNEDSTGVKVNFKNKTTPSFYIIDIYINNVLYKSRINADCGFIYLPDTIKNTDHIKVIVSRTKQPYSSNWSYTVKHKEYTFKLSESSEITIIINYKKKFSLFKRRYRMGNVVGYW